MTLPLRVHPTVLFLLGFAACNADADTTNASASAGAAGSSGAAGTSGEAGTGGTAGAETVRCPSSSRGPTLVGLRSPTGTAYCIDATPVTWGQYHQFTTEVPFDKTLQPDHCEENTDFAPRVSQPSQEPSIGCDADFMAAMSNNMPMTCIDWCDAAAFCAWAGKRLCGEVGGGKRDLVPAPGGFVLDELAKASEDEWFNACSVGGTSKYPFGDSQAGLSSPEMGCGMTLAQENQTPLWDVTMVSSCHATAAPFDQVLWMAGGLMEFESSCYLNAVGQRVCGVHGGMPGPGGSIDEYGCTPLAAAAGVEDATRWTTFRCCADAL